MNFKYNVLTGCSPYRTNNYWKAIIALVWRQIKFGRGWINKNEII